MINYILNSTNGTLNVIVKGKPVTVSKATQEDKYNKVLQLIKIKMKKALLNYLML